MIFEKLFIGFIDGEVVSFWDSSRVTKVVIPWGFKHKHVTNMNLLDTCSDAPSVC